jgi:hypothetical protein
MTSVLFNDTVGNIHDININDMKIHDGVEYMTQGNVNDTIGDNIPLHACYVMGLFAGLFGLRVGTQGGCLSSQVAADWCRWPADAGGAVAARGKSIPALSYGVGRPQWRRRTKARHGLSIQGEGAGSPCLRRGCAGSHRPGTGKAPKPGRPPYRASLTAGTSLPPRGNAVPTTRYGPRKLALFVAGVLDFVPGQVARRGQEARAPTATVSGRR